MYKGLAVALIIIGVILIISGVDASNSFDSELSRAFTGTPTNESMWFLIGGVLSSSVGMYGLFSRIKL